MPEAIPRSEAKQTPQERLMILHQKITGRMARYWEPDLKMRSGALPFRKKHRAKVIAALFRQNPRVPPLRNQHIHLTTQDFREALVERTREGNHNALEALCMLGASIEEFPEAREALTDAIQVLAKWGCTREINDLCALDEKLLEFPEIRESLADAAQVQAEKIRRGNIFENMSAISNIERMGSSLAKFPELVQVLAELAKNGDGTAIRALGKLGSNLAQFPEAVQSLALHAKQVDTSAMRALCVLGASMEEFPEAREALTDAIQVLAKRVRRGSKRAINELGEIGVCLSEFPETLRALPKASEALVDTVKTVVAVVRTGRNDWGIKDLGKLSVSLAYLSQDKKVFLDTVQFLSTLIKNRRWWALPAIIDLSKHLSEFLEVKQALEDAVPMLILHIKRSINPGDAISALVQLGENLEEFPEAIKALSEQKNNGALEYIEIICKFRNMISKYPDLRDSILYILRFLLNNRFQYDNYVILDMSYRWQWRFFDLPDLMMVHVQDLAQGNHSVPLPTLEHQSTIISGLL